MNKCWLLLKRILVLLFVLQLGNVSAGCKSWNYVCKAREKAARLARAARDAANREAQRVANAAQAVAEEAARKVAAEAAAVEAAAKKAAEEAAALAKKAAEEAAALAKKVACVGEASVDIAADLAQKIVGKVISLNSVVVSGQLGNDEAEFTVKAAGTIASTNFDKEIKIDIDAFSPTGIKEVFYDSLGSLF